MARTTKNELLNFFMHFCRDVGKSVSLGKSEVESMRKFYKDRADLPCEIVPYGTKGAWRLDYAGCYGGWQIQEMCEGGGISCPFGNKRRPASSLLDMICFAREALRLKNNGYKCEEPA